jgi:hypothetical protein
MADIKRQADAWTTRNESTAVRVGLFTFARKNPRRHRQGTPDEQQQADTLGRESHDLDRQSRIQRSGASPVRYGRS